MSTVRQFRVTLSPACTIDVCGDYTPLEALQAARDAMEGCIAPGHMPIVRLCIAGADGKWARFDDVTPATPAPVQLLVTRYLGARVRLTAMFDKLDPILPGTLGTVDSVDDAGTLHMRWDNGRTLGLIPGLDSFELVTASEQS